MDKERRRILKGSLAVAGLAAFGAGYYKTASDTVEGVVKGSSGHPAADPVYGNALTPELKLTDQGELEMNPDQSVSPSVCCGCWTLCGVRLRIDKANDRLLRISGNPYHPLSAGDAVPYYTSVRDAYKTLAGESGMSGRSTACARGNAMLEMRNNPYRITQPMKRVGLRGAGKWEPISFEQLIREIVEGGDLFGEGSVEGLRTIRDLITPVDKENPEYGPKANQLLVTNAGDEGRTDILKRFAYNSFGTRNFGHHGSFCGYAFRMGAGAWMTDNKSNPHMKPDWENTRFCLLIGSSPAQSGNPFKRQGRQLAGRRVDPDFDYVVIAPALPASSCLSTMNNRWIPIKPGTDSALVLGMMRWIFEHDRYNKTFLEQPGPVAMASAGEIQWSNATHLVISDQNHPRFGAFLRASDVDWSHEGADYGEQDPFLVVQKGTEQLVSYQEKTPAELFVDRIINTKTGPVPVKTSLLHLREETQRFSLEEYSRFCGIPVDTIKELANKFTSYGTRVSVDTHGGNMHSNGFYNAYAIVMLNTLVGNMSRKGGMVAGQGSYTASGKGERYDLENFPGKIQPKGICLSRSNFRYEDTSEFKRKKARGQSAYPAKEPWYTFPAPLLTEHLTAAVEGYPYHLKAWINHMGNPLYGVPGLEQLIGDQLRDPKVLPLIVSVDAFINETTAISDYIVPDTVTYESWGFTKAWHGVPAKVLAARWPTVRSKTPATADGHPVGLETFLVAVAKSMGLPGFGSRCIPDKTGHLYDFNCAEDFYLRAAANLAWSDGKLPSATEDDIHLSGLDQWAEPMQKILKPDEVGPAAFALSRGGRFGDCSRFYEGETIRHKYSGYFSVWNEKLALSINSFSGKHYVGCPTWYPQQLADGSEIEAVYPPEQWPMKLTNFKSNIHSAVSCLSPKLLAVKSFNPVWVNRNDATRLHIENGELVKLVTPSASLEAVALLVDGVMPGTLGIEHGFGHRELGFHRHTIGNMQQPKQADPAGSICINYIGLSDASRHDQGLLLDWVVGAAARQAIPARLERIDS